jgi:eukaryotic-like serine/threonine-protein kinase
MIAPPNHRIPPDILAAALGVRPAALAPLGVPGGQGEVWRVSRGGKDEAVKVYIGPSDPHRIPAEIEALTRVRHPNVVTLLGQSTLRIGSQNCTYLRYELVPGVNLDQALARGVPTPSQLAGLGRGLLGGLAALASKSVVHRDFKPLNVVLRGDAWDKPVIIDFGLVRLVDQTTKTIYPWAHGTWPWMAPEQLLGERAYARADVFAAGVILYQARKGRHPFLSPQELRQHPPADYSARLRSGPDVVGIEPRLARLLKHCLQPLAVRRPSADQALTVWNSLP